MDERTGSCLCGAVRISVSGPLRPVVYCHCGQCRKQTGHYYAATSVADSDLRVDGAGEITWYSASPFARRGFCRRCGSALFWKAEGEPDISILAGLFDNPTGLAEAYHIFVADKGDYYRIADGLPQHDTAPAAIKVDRP